VATELRAVIFAGGLGTRLRPYTTVLPKPLIPVGEEPILAHILRRLHACGVRRADLCVGHLAELIRLYFSETDSLPPDLELRWHREDEPLGTAGALRLVSDLGGTFIAMNGDILTTLDYRDLVDFHERSGAALTVATHARTVDIDLGVIEVEGDRIVGYREKPRLDYEVSMGIYAYDERALAHLPAKGPYQFPELVQRLLDAGEEVASFHSDAQWYDIGTPPEHQRAVDAFERSPDAFAP
jgi:NDP-sugar pyrophosphorylase family protein